MIHFIQCLQNVDFFFAQCLWGRHSRDHLVFGFTTTYAISAYHN